MRRKALLAARILFLVGLVGTLAAGTAWGQTPEGTVITNTATVSWTDANSNSYTPVSAQVSVTVGFTAGIDAIAGAASVSPSPGSTGNTLTFTIDNIGNGADSVSVGEAISVGGIISVTGYQVNGAGPIYNTLADLNTALAGTAISTGVGNGITIDAIYDAASGTGGQSTVYTLTATSRRDNTVSDADATTITPAETLAVAVTPDGGQNLQHLPSNGTNYTFNFTVTNNGDGPEDFDLRALVQDASDVSIVSVNAVAGDSTRISLGAAANATIAVVYSVLDVAAGTQDTVTLRARSVTGPGTAEDSGFADLTVIRPSLAITKEVYRDDQSTVIGGADTVLPGEYIQYKISVTNNGDADASGVHIDDLLPVQLTFDGTTPDAAGWTITNSGNDVDADLSGALAPTASRYFWIRVQIN